MLCHLSNAWVYISSLAEIFISSEPIMGEVENRVVADVIPGFSVMITDKREARAPARLITLLSLSRRVMNGRDRAVPRLLNLGGTSFIM